MSDADERLFEGTADRISPPHHVGFDRALEEAVARAADEPGWAPGETRSFSVNLVVEIVKTNPGWIGGYKVILKPGG